MSVVVAVVWCNWCCVVLDVYLSICKIENEAILLDSLNLDCGDIKNSALLRGFLNFWTWRFQKRSNSAIHLKHGKMSVELAASYQGVLRCSIPFKLKLYSAPTTKKWGQLIRSAAPHTRNHLSEAEDLRQEISAQTSEHVWLMSRALRLPGDMHPCTASSHVPPANASESATRPSSLAHFWESPESLAPATQNHIPTLKTLRDP